MNNSLNLLYLVLSILFVIIFWPILKWVVFIVVIAFIALVAYLKYQFSKSKKMMDETQFEQRLDEKPLNNDDVIDVTFKEKEIDESTKL